MGQRLSSFETRGTRFSPFIDVAINGMAAMFVFLVVYIAVVPPRKVLNVPKLRIVTETLPAAAWYQGYQTAIGACGGVEAYEFSVAPVGLLDQVGLSFDETRGVIEGNPRPLAPDRRYSSDSLSFLVTVRDQIGQVNSSRFIVLFKPVALPYDPEEERLRMQAQVLPSATEGREYEACLGPLGGVEPYQWSLTGDLPLGLRFRDGRIFGVPAYPGMYTFNVALYDQTSTLGTTDTLRYWRRFMEKHPSDIENSYTITVDSLVPLKCTVLVAEARADERLSGAGLAFGGTGHKTWVAKKLPSGLSLDPNTGVIEGTLDSVDTGFIEVEVVDHEGQSAIASLEFPILPPAPTLAISVPENIFARVGEEFILPLSWKGAKGPVEWRIVVGKLPKGLSLSQKQIVGFPEEAGTGEFTLEIDDEYNRTLRKTIKLVVKPRIPSLQIVTEALPPGVMGKKYDLFLTARGGEGDLTWKVAGELPAGCLWAAEGRIHGTPADIGTYSIRVTVSDEAGSRAGPRALELPITRPPPPPLNIVTRELPVGRLHSLYQMCLQAEGGYPPYSWDVKVKSLPRGLQVKSECIVGIPRDTGTVVLNALAKDSLGMVSESVNLMLMVEKNPLVKDLAILTEEFPTAMVGVRYSCDVSVEGGLPPLTYNLASSLPPGLDWNEKQGVLAGIPEIPGDWELQVTVRDSTEEESQRTCTMKVVKNETVALSMPKFVCPRGEVGEFYHVSVPVAGGLSPLSFSVEEELPPGVTLDTIDGVISGTPAATGRWHIKLWVRDALEIPREASQMYTIFIAKREVSPQWVYLTVCLAIFSVLSTAFLMWQWRKATMRLKQHER